MESLMYLLAATSAADLLQSVLNALYVAVGLGLVIFFHELGHFAVAKWCDVHVERFSIGFGPVLLSWKSGETEYALSAIPFGGYVKMLGQDDSDPSQLTSEELAEDPRSYSAKNVWQRMAIISAGVTMNVITAVFFFAAAYGFGVENPPAITGQVQPGMPAWQAGIEPGDRITQINGREISSFNDLLLNVALSSGPLEIEGIRRDGKTTFDVTIVPDQQGTRPKIGIGPTGSLQLIDSPKHDIPVTVAGTAAASAKPPFEYGDTIREFNGQKIDTYVELQELLASRPVEPVDVVVERPTKDDPKKSELVTISLGADVFHSLGLRVDTGPIAAIRDGSPAEKAGLKVGDKLAKIDGLSIGTEVDCMRLPNEFAARHGNKVEIVVVRRTDKGPQEEVTLEIVPDNLPGWLDQPEFPGDPLSIPAIGAVIHAIPAVVATVPDSPAAKADIQPGSLIQKLVILPAEGADGDDEANKPQAVSFVDIADGDKNSNNWVHAYWLMQRFPNRLVKLSLMEKGALREVELRPVPEPDWVLPRSGLNLMLARQVERADGVASAFGMAMARTQSTIRTIYLTLRNLVTLRLSYKELHGPLGIAKTAYMVADQGWADLLLFLGFLSVNLAVLNFLPIPVLDGGHMVFLLWELVTRRKPSESVVIGATYTGMAFLLGLMTLVLYLDVFEHGFFGK